MARWKLTEPHYLNVPGTEWEQTVIDPLTQKPVRKKFSVPRHLDPRVVDDWNWRDPQRPMDGEIHVCWLGKGQPRDIEFIGDPTPGMVPLDAEAEAATAKLNLIITQKVSDGFIPDEATQQAKVLSRLMTQLADATVAGPQAPAGFESFMESMAKMMQQQTAILAQILSKTQEGELERQAKALGEARPVEEVEALNDLAPTEDELRAATEQAAKAEAASHARAQAHVASRRV